ncbi:MAG: diacylglycerol kinase family protein, partial [Nostocoides sp.]
MTGSAGPVVVVNPTKFADLPDVRRVIAEAAEAAGCASPRFVETTEDDPGGGQTREALAAGATLVCALGGDGTVRAVAQELVGTGARLGLLPGGTGNLLARNLGTPVDDLAAAVRLALTGADRTIDVGWLCLDPSPAQMAAVRLEPASNVHVFTVMAGVGFDADIMDDAPEAIKAKAGWAAYVASAARHLADEPFAATVGLDGTPGTPTRARTVVVGNCGELTGGIVLLPEARVDDGSLDVAVLTPESLAQWASLAGRVLAGAAADGPSIERSRAREVVIL